jgi:SRSO17 transposase
MTSSTKHQPSSKPYLERVNHYAETRARIFNDTSDPSSNPLMINKQSKTNPKQHSNFVRPSYRKQQQQQQHQNSSHQHRSYTYQQATNNHMQQYPTGKTIDPSSHMLNTSTTRSKN